MLWSTKDVLQRVFEWMEAMHLPRLREVNSSFKRAVDALWAERKHRWLEEHSGANLAPELLNGIPDGAFLMLARASESVEFEIPEGKGRFKLSWKCKGMDVQFTLRYWGSGATCVFTGGLTRNRLGRDENFSVKFVTSKQPYVLEDLQGASFGGIQGYVKLDEKTAPSVSKVIKFNHWIKKESRGPALIHAVLDVQFETPRCHFKCPVVIASFDGVPFSL